MPHASLCRMGHVHNLVSNDRNAFDDAFVRAYPDCEIQTQKRASRRLGAGQPRYALCNIGQMASTAFFPTVPSRRQLK